MTDAYFDLTNRGSGGRQPITNVGRVVLNVRLDQEELEDRQKPKNKNRSLYPTASTNDGDLSILPGDILLSNRKRNVRKSQDGFPLVFSVINAAGEPGMTHAELIDSLTFKGFAGSGNAVFDTTGKRTRWPDTTGVIGGLYTVANNGSERIQNGDLIYWDLPEIGTNKGANPTPERVTAVLRPYNPRNQKITAQAVAQVLLDKSFVPKKAVSTTEQAAGALARATEQITVNAFYALLESGLVRFDENAVSADPVAARNARHVNASAWAGVREEERDLILARVAGWVGCRNATATSCKEVSIRGESLKHYVLGLLAADDAHMIVGLNPATNTIPATHAGEVLRNQSSCLADMIAGTSAADYFVRRRIVGKAITPFASGREGDVIIGHYSH